MSIHPEHPFVVLFDSISEIDVIQTDSGKMNAEIDNASTFYIQWEYGRKL